MQHSLLPACCNARSSRQSPSPAQRTCVLASSRVLDTDRSWYGSDMLQLHSCWLQTETGAVGGSNGLSAAAAAAAAVSWERQRDAWPLQKLTRNTERYNNGQTLLQSWAGGRTSGSSSEQRTDGGKARKL